MQKTSQMSIISVDLFAKINLLSNRIYRIIRDAELDGMSKSSSEFEETYG